MKKFAKMSLAAAVAVSGLSTAAVAGSLEEAVKNTDISGKVYVEFLSTTDDKAGEKTKGATDFDFDITFKTKVNDNVTAVTELEADSSYQDGNKVNTGGNGSASQTDQTNEISLKKIYFAYTNGNISANVGRMGAKSPLTDGDRYEGASVTYNAGMASIYVDHGVTNDDTTGDVTNFAVMGSAGPVNAEVWYTNYSQGTSSDFGKTLTVAGDAEVEGVKVSARYARTDYNTDGAKDGVTMKFGAETTISNVTVHGTYLTTDDEGASATTDVASANSYELSQLDLAAFGNDAHVNANDLDLWAIGASTPVADTTYKVDYASLEQDTTNSEATELRFRAVHQMSSNFKVMGTYSIYEEDNSGVTVQESNSARIDFKYSF